MKKTLTLLMILFCTSLYAQQKIGHVNSQKLLDTLASYKEAGQKLEQKRMDMIGQYQALEKAFQASYDRLAQEAADMPKLMLEEEQKKLMIKQEELQNFEPEMTRKLQMYQQQYMEPILKRVQDAIALIANKKKLNYIFDESVSLFSAGGIDCTEEVMVELIRLDEEAMKSK